MIVRMSELTGLVGLSKEAIYRKIRENEFPQPIELSARSVGWRKNEIEEWVKNRPRATGNRFLSKGKTETH